MMAMIPAAIRFDEIFRPRQITVPPSRAIYRGKKVVMRKALTKAAMSTGEHTRRRFSR
jgi:hypothetical protein